MAEQRGRWLNTVVQSMGDAVMTVDRQGKVTMLNPAAERLTGWMQSDAIGKPVEEVVPLLDAESRRPIMNPAVRALQRGIPPDLAQRPLLLIGRQGDEHRIDETVTAIHDDKGDASGVVMVFRAGPKQG
jgi:PAS domain S-box-containing protein